MRDGHRTIPAGMSIEPRESFGSASPTARGIPSRAGRIRRLGRWGSFAPTVLQEYPA
jgi:hypothetical protein